MEERKNRSEEMAGPNDIHEVVQIQSSPEERGEQPSISDSWQLSSSSKETAEYTAISNSSDKSMAKVEEGNNDLDEEQMDVQGIEVEIETEREAERETVKDDEIEMDQGKDGPNDEGCMGVRNTDDEGQGDGDYDEAMKRAYDTGERTNDTDEASNDMSGEETCQNEWSGTTANVYRVPDYVGEREFPDNVVIGTNTRVFVLMAGVLWPTRVIIQDQ